MRIIRSGHNRKSCKKVKGGGAVDAVAAPCLSWELPCDGTASVWTWGRQLGPCNTVGSENRVRQHIKQLTVVTFCGLTSTSFARNRFLELLSSMGLRCFLMLIICTECTGESTQCSFGDPNTLYNGQGRREMRT